MKHIFFKFWILLLLSGCGYNLVGTGSTLPEHLKTISIPVFTNNSSQPEIHRELTSAVIDSFVTDGRIKVVKKSQADMVMTGNLFYYDLRTVAFSANDFAEGYIVELGVDVEVMDKVNNIPYLKQHLRTNWNYKATPDIVDTESARLAALNQAYQILGNRLVSLLINQF